MTFFELLIPLTAILGFFGVGGYIGLKALKLLRDWLVPDSGSGDFNALQRRLEQTEHRQEQLVKRVQNLETIVVDSESDPKKLDPHPAGDSVQPTEDDELSARTLKNKLRS